MSEWKDVARMQQVRWKHTTRTLPPEARADGVYFVESRGRARQESRTEIGPYAHCLPRPFATCNLLSSVRDEALARLHRFGIAWHAGTPGVGPEGGIGPTTNLLDSQIQCINTLLSLEMQPALLLDRLRIVEPDARTIVPIRHPDRTEAEGLVAFEWIGRENYLCERIRGERQRGTMVTSADALIVLERRDGHRTGILVEWKFTESYDRPIPPISRRGTDRRDIYRTRYESAASPFIAERPLIDAYFHDPHYQLLRLSLLAQGMLQAGEHGVDRMVVLDLAPEMNRKLMDCVPDALRPFGGTVDEIWRTLVPGRDVRFVWQDTKPWVTATSELAERYGGLFGS